MRPSAQLHEAIFGLSLGKSRKKKKPIWSAHRPFSTKPLKGDDVTDWFSYLINPEGKIYGCHFGSHEGLEKALAKKKLAPSLSGASRKWYSTKLIEKGWAKISSMGTYTKLEAPDAPTGSQNRAIRDIIGAHAVAAKAPDANPNHKKFVQSIA